MSRHARTKPEEPPVPPLWVRDGTIALAALCGATTDELDDVVDQVKIMDEPALPSEVIIMFHEAIKHVRNRREDQARAKLQ